MSVDDTAPPDTVAATTAVAESLSTVGYAMFALLQTGPLDDISSLSAFMEQVQRDEEAAKAAAEAAAAEAASIAASAAAQPAPVEQDSSFGNSNVDETMGAVGRTPAHTFGAPQQISASSVQIPTSAPVLEPAAAAAAEAVAAEAGSDETPAPHIPKPLADLPEYNGAHTMQMLQEISFLEE